MGKPRKGRTRSRQSGYTLIELMASMLILSLGVFPLLQLQYVTIRGHGYARERQDAMQIATGVAEMIKTRGLAMNQFEDGSGQGQDFETAFPEMKTRSAPAMCDSLTLDHMSALRSFDNNVISSGDTGSSAYLINVDGLGPEVPSASPVKLEAARAIYMVHYVAHPVVTRAGEAADPSLQRVTVFVSWDNKNYGKQNPAIHAFNPTSFWNRHMVSVTFYLNRSTVY